MKNNKLPYVLILAAIMCATSCRKEEGIVPSTSLQVIYPDPNPGEIKGFFLLNEGNMGNNKATLDYFDYETGIYTKNIYAERNPGVVKELGDVGNDLQIYGNRLYAVINCSNFVEVMDVNTAKHIGVFSIPNCRYITFKGKYAYVSSYAGPVVESDPNYRLGYVAKVDTASLEIIAICDVGYQPEEMVVAGNKLYVANSGGYRYPDYDRTVSVIDLETFTEIKKIETTLELVEIIKSSVPEKYRREKHPARKVFQAIRIEVNDELNVFEKSLKDSLDLLKIGGRICVITFHSLEDRMCKEIFNEVSKVDKELNKLPIIPEEFQPKFKIVANISPTKEEIEKNKRARSARLRVIERVK